MLCVVDELARILVLSSAPSLADEVSNVASLARAARVSMRTLQARCQVAGVKAHSCVRFVQCFRYLRAVGNSPEWHPIDSFPVLDLRTAKEILRRAQFETPNKPSLDEFVRKQQFVLSKGVIEAVSSLISSLPAEGAPFCARTCSCDLEVSDTRRNEVKGGVYGARSRP